MKQLTITWRETTETTAKMMVTDDYTFHADETARLEMMDELIVELDPSTFTEQAVLERVVWSAEIVEV